MKLLLIGSITHSIAKYKDGTRERFGGGVMYAGKASAELGFDTTVLTIGSTDIEPGMDELRQQGVKVHRIERNVSNNFSNDYSGEKRQMYMRSNIDSPIVPDDIKIDLKDFDCVILYPLYYEVSSQVLSMFSPERQVIMLDPQGFTRKLGEKNEDGLRPVIQTNWESIEDFAKGVDVLKLSDEDLEKIEFPNTNNDYISKCQKLVDVGFSLAILTRAEKPTIVVGQRNPLTEVQTYKVEVTDSAGAGDIFAVAFMYEYFTTGDPIQATKFANACSALKISGEKYDLESVAKKAIEHPGVFTSTE